MVQAVGTERRGRGTRRAERQVTDTVMLPALKRQLPLTEPMDQEQIERIDGRQHGYLGKCGGAVPR